MKISTDYRDEFQFPKKPSGGYEWWYFDAISNDGKWSFVIIFYLGNPFSPEYIRRSQRNSANPNQFPAVSVSIYHNYETEFYSFFEYSTEDFKWLDDKNEFKLGSNSFKRIITDDHIKYHINIDQILPSKHSLKAEIEFGSEIKELSFQDEENLDSQSHLWNLIQPKAKVSGELELNGRSGFQSVEFNGSGYHDHNSGNEPMKDDFEDWYWGRFHFESNTLIYYVMNKKEGKQYEAWLIDNNSEKVVDEFDSIEQDYFSSNKLGLQSAKKMILKSKSSEVTIQSSGLIDEGPFYQRFISAAIIKTGERVETASGISEYIRPKKIYSKIYWPLINMRLRYKYKKSHWVQRFKRFYEWTW